MAEQIFLDGQPRWHGLIVRPMREDQAEGWLEQRGVYAFHTVPERKRVIKGKQRRYVSRYLPGYVFARFPGHAIMHRVTSSMFIRDTIRLSDGRPAVLDPRDLRQLHAMREVDQEQRDAAKRAKSIRKGDRVRIMTGVMAGQEVEVLDLSNGRAKFMVRMFAADVPAESDVGELEKVNQNIA